MNRAFKISAACMGAAFLLSTLCACAQTPGGSESGTAVTARPAAAVSIDEPDLSSAVSIILSENGVSVTGAGAEADGSTVTITSGGIYTVTGTLPNGQLIVNAPKEEVTLVLDNADISCSDSSAIYIFKSSLTTIYLPDGSSSSLTDGKNYSYDGDLFSADDEEPNACLYSKADLVIAGGGSLTVNAVFNNGITGKDSLTISGVSLSVSAANHGVTGKDSLTVNGASVTVASGGDALRSTNDSDELLGYVSITDSTLDLTSGEDGIQAETALTVSGGSTNITSGGGSGVSPSDDTSAKGIKAGQSIDITGGSFILDCSDDAIHSNGSVDISGGSFEISTGDDGVHADEDVSISGGDIIISKSYEGIEGKTVSVSGGSIVLTASDDGINAADGSGSGGFGPGFFGSSSDCSITISGGSIVIDAYGDGLDSNGSILVSGGEVYITGPSSDGDGAIDCDGEAVVTGGTVVAAGSSGMAQNFGTGSTQGSMLVTFSGRTSGTITVTDESGNVLAEYTPGREYSSVVVSCPGLVQDGTYTVTAGSQSVTVTLDNLIYGSGFGGDPGGMGGGTPPDGGNMTPPDGGGMTPPGGTGTPPERPSGGR